MERSETGGDETEDRDDASITGRIGQEERNRRLRMESLRALYADDGGTTVGRDWYGGSSFEIKDHATALSAGRDLNVFASDGPPVQTTPLSRGKEELLAASLVETDSLTRLTALLGAEAVVLLRGPHGSGRTATAFAALLKVTKVCYWLWVKDDPLRVRPDDLEEGAGYVLIGDEEPWAENLAVVADRLEEVAACQDARIVVLIQPACDLAHRVVDHDTPPGDRVFRNLLAHYLDDLDSRRTHGLDRHALPEWLTGCRPQRAADLARKVADAVRQGRPVQEALDEQALFTPQRLRTRLGQDYSSLGRCFLVSSAVLHGLPEPIVSKAALDLAERLLASEEDDDAPREPPVWEDVETWLDDSGIKRVRSADAGEGQYVQVPEGLARTLLPVIWEELPGIREHLYAWLRELAESTDERVRIKVAHSIGLLATRDFAAMEEEFLDGWSRASTVAPRQLAAWALEAAASDPALRERVHHLLRSWSAVGPYPRRTTAAIAYGSRIGIGDIEQVLASFQLITASTASYWLCDAMARSMTDVYVTGTAPRIVTELARWAASASYGRRLVALQALVRLARIGPGDGRPALFDHPEATDLVGLWSRSLEFGLSKELSKEKGTMLSLAGEAWRRFGEWVRQWPRRPSLRPVLTAILRTASSGDPRLRNAYRLHLLMWRHNRLIDTSLFHRLTRLVQEG